MIDVVSPPWPVPRSLGMAAKLPVFVLRVSGAPQLEQYLARSGFGRPHRAQYIPPAMASPGLPSRGSAGSSIASGDAASGTRAEGSGSTRHANSRRRPPLGAPSG